jgi:hypothetical protein
MANSMPATQSAKPSKELSVYWIFKAGMLKNSRFMAYFNQKYFRARKVLNRVHFTLFYRC